MENKIKLRKFWKNKRVLITGHTGFKGAWLSIWLKMYGAKIAGISLPPKKKSIYNIANLKKIFFKSTYLDINNLGLLKKEISKIKPSIIFHMAAQPLVINSYKFPLKTIKTNVLGTANILEICKNLKSLKTILVITTDKVYKNLNNKKFFNEQDELGGDDIYSYSKASVEILVNAYKKSFFGKKINIATARAGNVIGGGDWSEFRIIPDFIRAYISKKIFIIRNPNHVRPWQHVMDCLFGYILLAENVSTSRKLLNSLSYNFGPSSKQSLSVIKIVNLMLKNIDYKMKIKIKKNKKFSEKKFLLLKSKKAEKKLKWKNKIQANESLNLTLDWYKEYYNKKNMYEYTCKQIQKYILKK